MKKMKGHIKDIVIMRSDELEPIFSMIYIQYFDLCHLFSTYIQSNAIPSKFTKFHQLSKKTARFITIVTDRKGIKTTLLSPCLR